jgi:hypothetical protein
MFGIELKERDRREIGRHFRNKRFELSKGGVLIDKGGMNLLANGVFIDSLYRNGQLVDRQMSPNLVVDEGLINMLNVYFNQASAPTAHYVGLFSQNATPQDSWNASNIVANSTELTGYTLGAGGTGSATNRPPFTTVTTTTKSVSNAASQAMFYFDEDGPYTARGAFIMGNVAAKGSTTGKAFAATRLAVDRTGLASPDSLGIQYAVAAADAG